MSSAVPLKKKMNGKTNIKNKNKNKQQKSQRQWKKKENKIENKQKNVDNVVAKKYDSKGTDPRIGPNLPIAKNSSPAGALDLVEYQSAPQPASLIGVAIGYVGLLCERGFASTEDRSVPYHLTQFLYSLMIEAMENKVLQVYTMPYSLSCLLAALRPKQLRYKTGQIALSWDMSLVSDTVPYIITGNINSTHLGVSVDGGAVESYGYNILAPPVPYTTDLGTEAWNKMIGFIKNIGDSPALRLVSATEKTLCDYDGSAFAMSYAANGLSNGPGGQTITIEGPVVSKSPMLSIFRDYIDYTNIVTESTVFASSARFVGERLLTFADERNIRSKFKPLFKFIDFNDLFNSLSYIVGKAVELALQAANVQNLILPCPLTGTQVALLVRALLSSFAHHAMGSDIQIDNFLALQYPFAYTNTATSVKNLMMPKWFCENLRAFQIIAKPLNSDKSANQIMLYIPVYGIFGGVGRSYDVTYGNGDPLYALESATSPRIDITNITTLPSTGPRDYICPSGEPLSQAIQVWNTWIEQFSSVMELDTLSSASTNPAFYALTYTRYITERPYVPPLPQNITNVEKRKSKDIPPPFRYSNLIKKVKVVNPLDTVDHQEIAVSSNQPFLSEIYDIMSNWVLPKVEIAYSEKDPSLNRYVALNYEPHIVRAATSQDNGVTVYPSLSSKFVAGSIIATKAMTGDNHPLLAAFINADNKGEGGFLGSILGDFAATTFGVPILSQIGNLLPF